MPDAFQTGDFAFSLLSPRPWSIADPDEDAVPPVLSVPPVPQAPGRGKMPQMHTEPMRPPNVKLWWPKRPSVCAGRQWPCGSDVPVYLRPEVPLQWAGRAPSPAGLVHAGETMRVVILVGVGATGVLTVSLADVLDVGERPMQLLGQLTLEHGHLVNSLHHDHDIEDHELEDNASTGIDDDDDGNDDGHGNGDEQEAVAGVTGLMVSMTVQLPVSLAPGRFILSATLHHQGIRWFLEDTVLGFGNTTEARALELPQYAEALEAAGLTVDALLDSQLGVDEFGRPSAPIDVAAIARAAGLGPDAVDALVASAEALSHSPLPRSTLLKRFAKHYHQCSELHVYNPRPHAMLDWVASVVANASESAPRDMAPATMSAAVDALLAVNLASEAQGLAEYLVSEGVFHSVWQRPPEYDAHLEPRRPFWDDGDVPVARRLASAAPLVQRELAALEHADQESVTMRVAVDGTGSVTGQYAADPNEALGPHNELWRLHVLGVEMDAHQFDLLTDERAQRAAEEPHWDPVIELDSRNRLLHYGGPFQHVPLMHEGKVHPQARAWFPETVALVSRALILEGGDAHGGAFHSEAAHVEGTPHQTIHACAGLAPDADRIRWAFDGALRDELLRASEAESAAAPAISRSCLQFSDEQLSSPVSDALWARWAEEGRGIFGLPPHSGVYISKLGARTRVLKHCGPTNERLRVSVGLSVPSRDTDPDKPRGVYAAACNDTPLCIQWEPRRANGEGCFLRVAESEAQWFEGQALVYDDSFDHEVSNTARDSRVALVVDVWHPAVPTELRTQRLGERAVPR